MVQKHWRAAKTSGDEAEDSEVPELLHWLCGKWEDHRGSSYDVSLSEKGAVLLSTTRPSGEVVNSNGLIRASAGRIVWGRAHQRKVYTLEKENNNTLRWRSSDEHGNAFDWKRQDSISSDDDSASDEQRAARGERRAQLRREYRSRRESTRAIRRLVGAGTDKMGDHKKDGEWRGDFGVTIEKGVEDKLLEFLTSPPEMPAPVISSTTKDLEQQWLEQQLYHNFHMQWEMWNSMQQEPYNYFAQVPVPGMPPPVWQNPFISAVATQLVGKVA